MAQNGGVVVVGSVNRDVTVRTDRFPAPGETVLGGPVLTGLGGKGANQAVAAARTGARTRFLATVGDDPEGQELVRSLVAAGVDAGPVARSAGLATGMALITVDATGENEIVVVAGANGATDARRVRAASAIVREADVVVAQAEIPSEAIAEVVDLGARVFVLNLAPFVEIPRDVLARVDVLVVNATEAGQVLGTPPPSSVEEALGAVRDLAGSARNAVITLGADGAVLAGAALGDEGHSAAGSADAAPGGAAPAGVTAARAADVRAARHVPVPGAVPVVDATGAGDAFVGVLAACLAKDMALDEAVASGVAAATRTVQVVGAAHAYPDFAALLRERTTVAGSADGAAGAISTAGPAAIGDRSGTQS